MNIDVRLIARDIAMVAACLGLSLGFSSCKKREDPKTVAPQTGEPAKRKASPSEIERLAAIKRMLELRDTLKRGEKDPTKWPILIYTDKNHRPIPQVAEAGPRGGRSRPLTMPIALTPGEPQGYSPYHYQVIDGQPVPQALPAGSSGSQGIGSDGARQQYDAESGDTTTWTAQGETIVEHSDGSFDYHLSNGFDGHVNPKGSGETAGSVTDGNGQTTSFNENGESMSGPSNDNGGPGNQNGAGPSNDNGGGAQPSNGNQNGGGPSNDNGGGAQPSNGNQNGGGPSNDNGGGAQPSNGNQNGGSPSNDNGGGAQPSNGNQNGGGKGNQNGQGAKPSNSNGNGPAGGGGSAGKGAGSAGGGNRPPGGSGSPAAGIGEPHYLSGDGTGYSSQAVGEFVLVERGVGQNIQVRTQPWKSSQRASAISAMAFQVGNNRVEVRLDGTVLIDGHEAPAGAMVQGDLANGGAIGLWRRVEALVGVVVVWPDFSICWITPRDGWLDFTLLLADEDAGQRGLLGNNDGDPNNDLVARDGATASVLNDAEVATFVQSWRVTAEESLFTYKPGESTKTYTMLDFPKDTSPAEITPEIEAACAHLPEGPLRLFAQLDLALTGYKGFLASYADHHRRRMGLAALNPQDGSAGKLGRPKMTISQAGGTLSATEREKAAALESNAALDETLRAGESKLYRLDVPANQAEAFGVLSEELDLIHYKDGMAGYQFYSTDGKALGEPNAAGRDLPLMKFDAGTIYLKIWGPGRVHIKLN